MTQEARCSHTARKPIVVVSESDTSHPHPPYRSDHIVWPQDSPSGHLHRPLVRLDRHSPTPSARPLSRAAPGRPDPHHEPQHPDQHEPLPLPRRRVRGRRNGRQPVPSAEPGCRQRRLGPQHPSRPGRPARAALSERQQRRRQTIAAAAPAARRLPAGGRGPAARAGGALLGRGDGLVPHEECRVLAHHGRGRGAGADEEARGDYGVGRYGSEGAYRRDVKRACGQL